MPSNVEFAGYVDEDKRLTVNLYSPIHLLEQPDQSWVIQTANSTDAQSAEILRLRYATLGITPLEESAEVILRREKGEGRIPTGNTQFIVSENAQVVFAIQGTP